MFNRMDPNGNGIVEEKEFEEYLSKKMEQKGITFQDRIKYFENKATLL